MSIYDGPVPDAKQPGSRGRARDLALVVLVVLLLVPFTSKPLHIDDPLFVWAGEALAKDPLHPYGTSVHWFESTQPMHEVMFNPPGDPYFIALVTRVFGSSERTLHLAFLLPAVLFAVGTLRLAGRWCRRPGLAVLAACVSPAFLVSATSLMPDVWMAALSTWSVAAWIDGIDRRKAAFVALGALLAGACILTKYVGFGTLPVLVAYALGRRARIGSWLPFLLLPLLLWGAYELALHAQTGAWPIAVASHASGPPSNRSPIDVALIAAAFLGGSALAPMILAWASVRKRGAIAFALGTILVVSLGVWLRWSALQHAHASPDQAIVVGIEFALLSGCGLAGLFLVGRCLWMKRGVEDLVLAVWITEILVYVSCVNWSISARALLPALPALAIVALRALDRDGASIGAVRGAVIAALLVLSAGISIELAIADGEIARSAKRAGEILVLEQRSAGRRVWYQGHWGFQYYAQRAGATAMEKDKRLVSSGDAVIVPMLNTNVIGVPEKEYRTLNTERHDLHVPLTTLGRAANAGFYSSTLGILPFGFGFEEPASYWVLIHR